MTKSILILGAGIMQLPAIRAARRLGLEVLVADANEHAPGIELADDFYHVDLKDRDGLVAAAKSIRADGRLDGVFTAGTDFSSSVSWVAQELNLPGTPFGAAMRATDKGLMRQTLRDAGIAVPDFLAFSAEELQRLAPADLASRLALPVVVKPVDSMGARGVVRADSWDDAYRFALEAVEHSRSGRVIIEGFVDGPEFSLDALVYENHVVITGFADRHIKYPPFFVEIGHTIPTDIDPGLRARIEEQFAIAVRALGLGPGAAKGDLKWSDGKVVVGEIANRLSGGYMSGWTYPFSSGVTLTEHAVRLALGLPLDRITEPLQRTSAERALLSIPGVVSEIAGFEAASSFPGIEASFAMREEGDRVVFPRNNVEKAANVIAVADDRAAAMQQGENAIAKMLVRLRANDSETDLFLYGAQAEACADGRNGAYSAFPWAVDLPPMPAADRRTTDSSAPVVWIPDDASGRDWAFRSASESIEFARSLTGENIQIARGAIPTDPGEIGLARALARGGAQGLVYALDSF